jgi:hypothetical protein
MNMYSTGFEYLYSIFSPCGGTRAQHTELLYQEQAAYLHISEFSEIHVTRTNQCRYEAEGPSVD